MASTIEKVLFSVGLGLAGTAAIYLYKEKKREGQEREGSKAKVETQQSKARVFPFTKMPEIDIKVEDNKVDKVEVPKEKPKQPLGKPSETGKGIQDSKEGENGPKNDNPKRSLIEDAKTALHKAKDALHGEQEETKEEKVGLFSWLMGKPKVEEQGAEENKNKEKKD